MSTAEATVVNLADLTNVSKKLNAKSNEVNQTLQDLEKKLVAMHLGITAWMPQSIPLTCTEEVQGDVRFSYDTLLGFGRHGNREMLLVKKLRYCERRDVDGGWGDCEFEHESAPVPLLQASRQIRIAALGQIEQLIVVLKAEGLSVINAIEKGRQTVDNL